MRKLRSDLCFVGLQKKPARFEAFFAKSTERILYEVRSGRKGKGRVLASVGCYFGAGSQRQALSKLKLAVGGIAFDLEGDLT